VLTLYGSIIDLVARSVLIPIYINVLRILDERANSMWLYHIFSCAFGSDSNQYVKFVNSMAPYCGASFGLNIVTSLRLQHWC
jgi:hypothetical protein